MEIAVGNPLTCNAQTPDTRGWVQHTNQCHLMPGEHFKCSIVDLYFCILQKKMKCSGSDRPVVDRKNGFTERREKTDVVKRKGIAPEFKGNTWGFVIDQEFNVNGIVGRRKPSGIMVGSANFISGAGCCIGAVYGLGGSQHFLKRCVSGVAALIGAECNTDHKRALQ